MKTRHIYAAGVATIEDHVLCGDPAEWSLAREFFCDVPSPCFAAAPTAGADEGWN